MKQAVIHSVTLMPVGARSVHLAGRFFLRQFAGSVPAIRVGVTLWLFCQTAATVVAQPGSLTGFSFLRLEPSAHAASMAGAFAASPTADVNLLFHNPAGLSGDMHRNLSVSYLNHVADINAGFLAYAHDLGPMGTAGGGIRYLTYGRMDRADETGFRDGTTFGATDVAATLAAARSAGPHLRYGVALNAVFSRIDDLAASALTADVGAIYDMPALGARIGLSIHHVGLVVSSLGESRDKLPYDVRFALSKELRYLPLLVSIMGYNLADIDPGDRDAVRTLLDHLALGGEFRFSDAFRVRLGYNHRRHEELKTKTRLDMAGFAFGFGLHVARVRFDYAYSTWSSLGGLHQLTVGLRI